VIVTLTPYTAQWYHEQAVYFASRGFPFLAVDVRGRGNSEGQFEPFARESLDGYDVVEWVARQPFCSGQVAMWGGSYGGYAQWATAKERPPHLATFVPVASVYPGVDYPMRNGIVSASCMQWLTLTAGRTVQDRMLADGGFWTAQLRGFYESGAPFDNLDAYLGNPSAVFQEWLSHSERAEYWNRYRISDEQYARLEVPILTITGLYDGDQIGALAFYREHLRSATPSREARHYLVIGPWDHAGTRNPQRECCGLKFGPESVIDLRELHIDWYAWTLCGGTTPAFLKKPVAYYVTGAEEWRYADTLEGITERWEHFYLDSADRAIDVFASGSLTRQIPCNTRSDRYVYDPNDVELAAFESEIDPENRVDQRAFHGAHGRQLIYHSQPLGEDVEVSGFFRLTAWIAIDQADTDFRVCVCEVDLQGRAVLLASDLMRARYRAGLHDAALIRTREPLRYDFQGFAFASRLVRARHRFRLIIGPVSSIHLQRNFNSGGDVSRETANDARRVAVSVVHGAAHPSVLHVPIARRNTHAA